MQCGECSQRAKHMQNKTRCPFCHVPDSANLLPYVQVQYKHAREAKQPNEPWHCFDNRFFMSFFLYAYANPDEEEREILEGIPYAKDIWQQAISYNAHYIKGNGYGPAQNAVIPVPPPTAATRWQTLQTASAETKVDWD